MHWMAWRVLDTIIMSTPASKANTAAASGLLDPEIADMAMSSLMMIPLKPNVFLSKPIAAADKVTGRSWSITGTRTWDSMTADVSPATALVNAIRYRDSSSSRSTSSTGRP